MGNYIQIEVSKLGSHKYWAICSGTNCDNFERRNFLHLCGCYFDCEKKLLLGVQEFFAAHPDEYSKLLILDEGHKNSMKFELKKSLDQMHINHNNTLEMRMRKKFLNLKVSIPVENTNPQ